MELHLSRAPNAVLQRFVPPLNTLLLFLFFSAPLRQHRCPRVVCTTPSCVAPRYKRPELLHARQQLLHTVLISSPDSVTERHKKPTVQAIASTPAFSRRCAPVRQGRSLVARATETAKIERTAVPLEMEEGAMPLNSFGPKKPFIAKIKSVKKIVGPKVRTHTQLPQQPPAF